MTKVIDRDPQVCGRAHVSTATRVPAGIPMGRIEVGDRLDELLDNRPAVRESGRLDRSLW